MVLVKFRFTGLGWLALPMFMVVALASIVAGGAVVGFDEPNPATGLVMIAVLLVGAAVHWWIGSALNRGTDRHTVNDQPLESFAWADVLVAWIALSIMVGRGTVPLVGWLVFFGAPLAAALLYAGRRTRRALGTITDRKALAEARGWRYQDRASGLPLRWQPLYGRSVYTVDTFGVLGGELGGLPFTVFDTENWPSARGVRSTVWAVHLPVAYPRLVMGIWQPADPSVSELFGRFGWDGGPVGGPVTGPGSVSEVVDSFFAGSGRAVGSDPASDEPRLVPRSDDPAFEQALTTPGVHQATFGHRLGGWRIEDRDLLLYRTRQAAHSAEEIVQVLEGLVALVGQFPPGLAHRFGRPPTTDVPFPLSSAAP